MPAADIVPGDVVIATAGERVPTDGRVLRERPPRLQELESELAAVDGGRTVYIA